MIQFLPIPCFFAIKQAYYFHRCSHNPRKHFIIEKSLHSKIMFMARKNLLQGIGLHKSHRIYVYSGQIAIYRQDYRYLQK